MLQVLKFVFFHQPEKTLPLASGEPMTGLLLIVSPVPRWSKIIGDTTGGTYD